MVAAGDGTVFLPVCGMQSANLNKNPSDKASTHSALDGGKGGGSVNILINYGHYFLKLVFFIFHKGLN